MSPRSKTETRTFATVIRFLAGFFRRSRIELRHRHEMNNDQSHKLRLRACLETTRGAVFGEKAGWRGATKENIPGGSSTEEQRSQTAFSAKTLRAAGLLSVAGVGSFLTARCGDARNSPPWPQPKSLAAAPLVVSKQALRFRASILGWSGGTGGEARDFYSWLTARLIWLSSPPQLPLRKRNKFMDNQKTNSM